MTDQHHRGLASSPGFEVVRLTVTPGDAVCLRDSTRGLIMVMNDAIDNGDQAQVARCRAELARIKAIHVQLGAAGDRVRVAAPAYLLREIVHDAAGTQAQHLADVLVGHLDAPPAETAREPAAAALRLVDVLAALPAVAELSRTLHDVR